jgi:alcohol dehydrogenase class IV
MTAMRFELSTPNRIVFGDGAVNELGSLASEMGKRAFMVTAFPASSTEWAVRLLSSAGVESTVRQIDAEPTVELVETGTRQAAKEGCDLVVGVGGGSAIDAAKAIAAMLANAGELYDYLEVIGRGQPLTGPSAPCIAVPTTAGTGAEVTRNAVLASPEHRVKVSLRSPYMLPRLALVDPALTHTVPPAVTAYTGLDALTQLIEPFVSIRANPFTDAVCRDGMRRAARSLLTAFQEGGNAVARRDMSLASLFGGLALANAGLGAVHGLAAPIGGMFPAPHGAICAALLPHVMEANLQALERRDPRSELLTRYREVSVILTGNPQASAEDGVRWVSELVSALRIPPLSEFGVRAEALPELAAKASSMRANPIPLTQREIVRIVESALRRRRQRRRAIGP